MRIDHLSSDEGKWLECFFFFFLILTKTSLQQLVSVDRCVGQQHERHRNCCRCYINDKSQRKTNHIHIDWYRQRTEGCRTTIGRTEAPKGQYLRHCVGPTRRFRAKRRRSDHNISAEFRVTRKNLKKKNFTTISDQ